MHDNAYVQYMTERAPQPERQRVIDLLNSPNLSDDDSRHCLDFILSRDITDLDETQTFDYYELVDRLTPTDTENRHAHK